MESKADKFNRLAALRHENATKAIRLMKNLARGDYESTFADRQALLDALQDDLDALAAAWGLPSRHQAPVDALPLLAALEMPEGAARAPVDGVDRRDIRGAYRLMDAGRLDEGMKLLGRVILGWAPDAWKHETKGTDHERTE